MTLSPDIGALELLVIAAVGLLVLGPQDLPRLLRAAGRLSNQVRSHMANFQRELMDLAPQTELEEVRLEVERLRMISSADPFNQATWVSGSEGGVLRPSPGREA